MIQQALICGGGIGGMATALACSRAGWDVRLFEQASAFTEVGAGIQLGPNVTRILNSWGLGYALNAAASFPEQLKVRCALTGRLLSAMNLGADMQQRYGAPYATIHRADLHGLLLRAVQHNTETRLNLNRALKSFVQTEHVVTVRCADDIEIEGEILVAADGLWSPMREQLLADGPPRMTGHLAYRTLLEQSDLPPALRSNDVTVWFGPRWHAVQYPVRQGQQLNVVVIVQGQVNGELELWDHSANQKDLCQALAGACALLQELVQASEHWRLWALHDRLPMQGSHEQAQGRVALLGDAAHPMRPYLAQGAGMAIEDAFELGRVLAMQELEHAGRLQRYAMNRWQRNAAVQTRSQRNGQVAHVTGLARLGRNASLKLLGARLLDQPWLYAAQVQV